ncbi:MAG TPA: M56 family metallopeptidase [Saprospiraceae bacterium]|nr:M56 family metallopeptidase [Saprospiraceae bacterium]
MTIFLLKLSLCWAFFALLYHWLLRQETFFKANRAYLIGTALFGILVAVWPAEQLPAPVYESGLPMIELPAVTVGMQEIEVVSSNWEQTDYLWVLYWIGFALALARMLWGLLKIVQMAVRGRSKRLEDGCLLISTDEAKVPFSFFKWVFVPEADEISAQSQQLMVAHERAHAHGWHSLDVLLMECLGVVFWFHPLAHWYRRSLRTVHEYLADAVAARQSDRKQYGLLLIGQSQSGMPVAFANHFFQSPLKQRLMMLTKKASAPVRAVKFGLVAPAALLFLSLFRQAPAIAQVVDEKHLEFVRQLEAKGWEMADTVVTFDPETYIETVQYVRNSAAPQKGEDGKLVYQYTEIKPQFPGGQEAMIRFLQENLKYPESAKQNKVEGTVFVSFVVDETGKVLRPYGQINMPNDSKWSLVEEAERVVGSMPKWIPAQHKGKSVGCSMQLPINFSLASLSDKSVDAQPEFPGGMEGLIKYLGEQVKYPEEAKKASAEGAVYLQFMVNEDGSLSQVTQVEGTQVAHPSLLSEAIRVVQAMPKWKPAMKEGKVVKTKFTLPIKFKLDNEPANMLVNIQKEPEFPGGESELKKFLINNIKYPEAAKLEKVEGQVVVTFVVEPDGSLSSMVVVKSPRQDLSDEFIRVLKLSPKWNPGMADGKAMRVRYTLPFKFKL